ncbi:MAG: hypothetical protein H0V80_18495, partial [Acidobacteria bacterium]|nr:hypothetical protein [Acidobacteriota bacterium]
MRTDMLTTSRRRLTLWVLALALSCAAGAFTWRYFSVALPIVSVDIRMDRSGALAAAEQLAVQRGWGPPANGARQSAAFEGNGRLQAFVEREAGGKDAFRSLTTSPLVSPYAWEVRRFAPGETREVSVVFRPDGQPFGFSDRLPEAAPGPAIPVAAARVVAERAATTDWQIDLSQYREVETAARTQPGKRVDHTFTYEHLTSKVGAAPIRLSLVVGGDRLIGVNRFVRVPEEFDRRYAAMRTGNDAIAGAAAIVIGVVLLIGGVGGGLVLLLRRGLTAWSPSIRLGLAIGALQLVAGLASYPMIWQGYDTAVNRSSFIAQWLLGVITAAGGMATLLALTFAAAEGLTRLAFASHPLLWRTWGHPAGASPEVARRTAIGYLMVPIDLAYVVGLYFFTTRVLGWWSPSDTLVDPNILASFLPWSTPVANALQAGVWEECLFRAVPLAGGALIGQRFGRRGLGIAVAMVLQTIIFGAGHANYPGTPAYARPVELIVPSLVFGV